MDVSIESCGETVRVLEIQPASTQAKLEVNFYSALFLKDFQRFICFCFICMCFASCMYVHLMHTWCPWRPDEGVRSSGTGVYVSL